MLEEEEEERNFCISTKGDQKSLLKQTRSDLSSKISLQIKG
jgi:hypothetical protein